MAAIPDSPLEGSKIAPPDRLTSIDALRGFDHRRAEGRADTDGQ